MSHFVLIQRGEKFPFLPKEKKFETPEDAFKALTPSTVKITEVYPNGTADLSAMNLKDIVDQRLAAKKEAQAKKRRSLDNRRVILDAPKKATATKKRK